MKGVVLILCVLVAAAAAAGCRSKVTVDTVNGSKINLSLSATVDFVGTVKQWGSVYCKERTTTTAATKAALMVDANKTAIVGKTSYKWTKTVAAGTYYVDCIGDGGTAVKSTAQSTTTAAAQPGPAAQTKISVNSVSWDYNKDSTSNTQKYLEVKVTASFAASSTGTISCVLLKKSDAAPTAANFKSTTGVVTETLSTAKNAWITKLTAAAGDLAYMAYCMGDAGAILSKELTAAAIPTLTKKTITTISSVSASKSTAKFAEVDATAKFPVTLAGEVACAVLTSSAAADITWAKINAANGKASKTLSASDNILYTSVSFTFKDVTTATNLYVACAGKDQAGTASAQWNFAVAVAPNAATASLSGLTDYCKGATDSQDGTIKSNFSSKAGAQSKASVTFAGFTSGETKCAVVKGTVTQTVAQVKAITGTLATPITVTTAKSGMASAVPCPLEADTDYSLQCAGTATVRKVVFYSKDAFSCPTAATFTYSGNMLTFKVTPTVDGTTKVTLNADKDVFTKAGATKVTVSDASCVATGNAESTKKLVVTVAKPSGNACALKKTAVTFTVTDNSKSLAKDFVVTFTSFTDMDSANAKGTWKVEAAKTGSASTTVPTLAAFFLGAVLSMLQL